jgi:hypothetical protein
MGQAKKKPTTIVGIVEALKATPQALEKRPVKPSTRANSKLNQPLTELEKEFVERVVAGQSVTEAYRQVFLGGVEQKKNVGVREAANLYRKSYIIQAINAEIERDAKIPKLLPNNKKPPKAFITLTQESAEIRAKRAAHGTKEAKAKAGKRHISDIGIAYRKKVEAGEIEKKPHVSECANYPTKPLAPGESLTVAEEHYCMLIAGGSTPSASYKEAFNTGNTTYTQLVTRASNLKRHNGITQRIEELKELFLDELHAMELWRRVDSVMVCKDVIQNSRFDAVRLQAVKILNDMNEYTKPATTVNNNLIQLNITERDMRA